MLYGIAYTGRRSIMMMMYRKFWALSGEYM